MKTLAHRLEIDVESLGEAFPFALLADKACRVAWAGPSVLERFPGSLGAALEEFLRKEDGEVPSLSLLEESLGEPGRWILGEKGSKGGLPLAGTWIRAGSGYLLLARPDPFCPGDLEKFSFRDFPWDDLPILYLTSQDEFRNTLDEVQAMADLLEKREAYLQKLLDTLPLGVILIDQETRRVAAANPCALELIGVEPGEVLGKSCSLFCSRLDGVCPYLDEGKPMGAQESILRRKDGSTLPILKRVTPLEMDGKKYILDTILDLRERKALERRVLQAQKMEAVGQLAAGVAHQINTPVQFIGDNLRYVKDAVGDLLHMVERGEELLERGGGDGAGEFRKCKEECDFEFIREEVPAALEQSLEGLERVGRIVEALNSFTAGEPAGKEPLDLNEAVEKALALSEGEWRRVARVELDLEKDLPPVPGRAGEIQQTLLILLANAAQAVGSRREREGRPEKGVIRIRTRRLEDSVEVRVQDDGTGIAEELRERIFDPFFSTKGTGIGSGKGLAYAHSIVAGSHGGEIFFESEEGKGATFVVRLPLGRD